MTEPIFRTEGDGSDKKLILQCSSCKRDIRLIDDNEQLNLAENRAGYFCSNCFEEGEFVQVLHQKLPPVPMLAQSDQPIDQEEPEDYWRDAIYLGKDGDHHMVQYEDGANEILHKKNQIRRLENGEYAGLKTFKELQIARDIEAKLEGRSEKEKAKIIKSLYKEYSKRENKSAKILADLKEKEPAVQDIVNWLGDTKDFFLQKNGISRLHKLAEACGVGKILGSSDFELNLDGVTSFVVDHDWGKVLDGAVIDGEEQLKTPYDICAFEFIVNGRCVICLASEADNSVGIEYSAIAECVGGFWAPLDMGDELSEGLILFLYQQVRAICIVLDAEVAEHEIVRAPVKLNQKREAKGKVKLSDYHVIDLSKRHRVSNPSSTGAGSKKRLHFRRGHWRHYAEHKTWVKWCLVGDPDLGFVNKHYRL